MENRPSWSSRYSFILAAIGSAVGLGNIWRFPYIMGQHGGAVFLITYLILITTICFIPLLAELAIGKITQKECIGAFETVNPKLKFFGLMNPITGVLVASFYFVVGGWIINYIYIGMYILDIYIKLLHAFYGFFCLFSTNPSRSKRWILSCKCKSAPLHSTQTGNLSCLGFTKPGTRQ